MAMIKFCSSEFCISHLPLVMHQLIALKEELCTANLLVGMTQCKHQGWSYISKQYIQFDSKFAIIQHQKTDPLHNCSEQLLSKSMPSTRSCEIFLFNRGEDVCSKVDYYCEPMVSKHGHQKWESIPFLPLPDKVFHMVCVLHDYSFQKTHTFNSLLLVHVMEPCIHIVISLQ